MTTIRESWQSALHAVEPGGGKEAIRAANLAIAAALAVRTGLIPFGSRRPLRARDLKELMETLALTPVQALEVHDWSALQRAATLTASQLNSPADFDTWADAAQASDSARKSLGAYATPSGFADRLAALTLTGCEAPPTIIDPSAGSGALLIAALEFLGKGASTRELGSIVYRLAGMEIDSAAREFCCHMIWLRSARAKASLDRIAKNIVCGNAITYAWNFDRQFDVLLMNPPWESLRHSTECELLNGERRATLERLNTAGNGDVFLPKLFTMQGTGDRNLAKGFLELAPHLLLEGGRLGALIPAAFASDLGMNAIRRFYLSSLSLERWTSYENLAGYFPIDGRYKFGLLVGSKCKRGTRAIRIRAFGTHPEDAEKPHYLMSRSMIERIGGPTRMIPEVGTSEELRVLRKMFRRGTPLLDHDGALGEIAYRRELDLTLDLAAGYFFRFEEQGELTPGTCGSFVRGDSRFVPLVEGRMVGQFDCFQKSWISGRGRTARWQPNGSRPIDQCRPQYIAAPRARHCSRIAICDVTSATNTRTVHATLVPETWPCGNTAPVLEFGTLRSAVVGMAVLNSMVFDWMARRLVSGLHLNRFYLDSMVIPELDSRAKDRIFNASISICNQHPRALVSGNSPMDSPARLLSRSDAMAVIEREVASSYGLSESDLRVIYNPDKKERRGFWRYFAAEPAALQVAQSVLEQ